MHIELKASFYFVSLIIETDHDNEIPPFQTILCIYTHTHVICSAKWTKEEKKNNSHSHRIMAIKWDAIYEWQILIIPVIWVSSSKFSIMIITIHAFNLRRYSWFYLTSIDPFRARATPKQAQSTCANIL